MATIDDFKKLSLRVAEIVSAEDHPNADKLYILTVETGGTSRKIVAGIRPYYEKEELQGKQCILIDNIEPVTIRGIQSEGMLLAAKDGQSLSILTVEKPVATGSPVS